VAGINERGEWRRLYPIPWRLFWEESRLNFKKWDIITLSIEKAKHDPRRESFKVRDPKQIVVTDRIESWDERRKFLYEHLDQSLEALKEENRSLGLVRPVVIKSFLEKERREIQEEGEKAVLKSIQTLLPEFEPSLPKPPKEPVPEEIPWLGYKFYCGIDCKGHEMMCIDWEIQELYRKAGFEKTEQKAFKWMLTRDIIFVVGTTWRFPTWMIIGIHYPPKLREKPLEGFM